MIEKGETFKTQSISAETTRARMHSSRMTHLGQSPRKPQKPTASILNPKLTTRIGNLNVRTMFETGKAAQVARKMERGSGNQN